MHIAQIQDLKISHLHFIPVLAKIRTMLNQQSKTAITLVAVIFLLIRSASSDWTLVLNPEQASLYAGCASSHSGDGGYCRIDWTDTTITLPPSAIFTDVFVSITGDLMPLPTLNMPTTALDASPSPAGPTSTVTWTEPVATATVKTSSASKPEASRPLLFMVLLVLTLLISGLVTSGLAER